MRKTKPKSHLLKKSINPSFQTGCFTVKKKGRNIDYLDLMYFIKHLCKG